MMKQKKLIPVMSGFIIIFFIHSCTCTGKQDSLPPYYEGTVYPPEINTEETVPSGNSFYVDPVTGSMENDGSQDSPWSTLQAVIENNLIETREYKDHPYTEGGELIVKNPAGPVKPGDTIILRTGDHGDVLIQDGFNPDYINVIAQDGNTPFLSRVHLQAASNWRFKGLTISSEAAPEYTLVFLESSDWHGPVTNVTVESCQLSSAQDSSMWTIEDWNTISCDGIVAYGSNITIRDNYLKNVDFGITVSGNFALVKNNVIENFSGDGMRGLGNDFFFEYNTVKNCYAVNANHDDGFQSWSINDDPPRWRVVLRGNVIINYVDPDQPFRGSLQGIGCFDGLYINWVIENNLVITDHWHGISMYGAINCRIVNNTVLDINGETPGPSWIAIVNHKDGTPSLNCLIRNNIANSLIIEGEGITEDHNYLVENFSDYENFFADPANFDFHLTADAPFINSGISESAPQIDIEGNPRPQGGAYDIGAYEYVE